MKILFRQICSFKFLFSAFVIIQSGTIFAETVVIPEESIPSPRVETLIKTVDFETAQTSGWYANAWGANFDLQPETNSANVHGGATSERFRINSTANGGVVFKQDFNFATGKRYKIVAWLKASAPARVQFLIRKMGEWYDPYALREVELTDKWQRVEVEAIPQDASALYLYVQTSSVNVYLDDIQISEVVQNELGPVSTANIPKTMFGVTVNRLGSHNYWAPIGQGILRLHDTGTHWKDVQPTIDTWDFSRLDYYVNYAQTSDHPDVGVLYTMGITPQWASSNPNASGPYGAGASAPPRDLAAWRTYVRTLGSRYKGKIRYWEIWNEWDQGTMYSGDVQTMVNLVRIARDELKAIDPNNKIIAPSVTVGGNGILESALRIGLADLIDIFALHWYYGETVENQIGYISNFKSVLYANGVTNKPIWNTEGGPHCDFSAVPGCDSIVPSLNNAESLVGATARAEMLMWSMGVSNFDYYFLEGPKADAALADVVASALTAEGVAYSEFSRWLTGSQLFASYLVSGKVYVFRLVQNGSPRVVLWSANNDVQTVQIPATWGHNVRRLDGSSGTVAADGVLTVGRAPILLE